MKEKVDTVEKIKNNLNKRGFTLLNTYMTGGIGKHHKRFIKYICPNGHTNDMDYCSFMSGCGCSICSQRKKLTIDFVKEKFLEHGFVITSDTYKDNKQKLDCVCPEGHQIKISYDKFFNHGRRCRICSDKDRRLKKEYVVKRLSNVGYTLLSDVIESSKDTITFMCDNGHIAKMRWEKFVIGHKCPECATSKRKTIEHVKNIFSERGYKLLSTEYFNKTSKLEAVCPKGHKIKITYNDFVYNGSGCRRCAYGSIKQENELEDILNTLKVGVVKRNDRNIIKPYELDLYVSDKNVAIELCGLYWHRFGIKRNGKSKHRDKYNVCLKNNISLLTVLECEYQNTNAFFSLLRKYIEVGKEVDISLIKGIDLNIFKSFMLKNSFNNNIIKNVISAYALYEGGIIAKVVCFYKNNNKIFMSNIIDNIEADFYDDSSFFNAVSKKVKEDLNITSVRYNMDLRFYSELHLFFKGKQYKVVRKNGPKKHYVKDRYKMLTHYKYNSVDLFYDCGNITFDITL